MNGIATDPARGTVPLAEDERVIYLMASVRTEAGDDLDEKCGYYNPSRGTFEVSGERAYARADLYQPEDYTVDGNVELSAADWLVDQVEKHLGVVEPDDTEGLPRVFRDADSRRDIESPTEVRVEMHFDGFTDEEVLLAAQILKSHGTLISWRPCS